MYIFLKTNKIMDYIFLIDVDFAQSRHHARHKFGCLGVTLARRNTFKICKRFSWQKC